MNNSSLASEFLIRAHRSLIDANKAFEDGDLVGASIRCFETIEYIARAILSLYGIFVLTKNSAIHYLDYLALSRGIEFKELLNSIEDLGRRLYIVNFIDESSLKGDTVIIRNKETEILIKEVEKLFQKAQEIFDNFHE
jgi:uncharacterized protein (UPF0332 family)